MNLLYKIAFWTIYAVMLILAVLPSRGNLSGTQVISIIRLDYILHFGAYFSICLYFIIGRKYGLYLFKRDSISKYIVIIVILASVTELIQLAVPSRAFNLYDLLANFIGTILGILIMLSIE